MASADPRSPDFDPRLLNEPAVSQKKVRKESVISHLLETLSPESLLQSAKKSAIHTAEIAPLFVGGPAGLIKGAITSGVVTAGAKGIEDLFKGKPENIPKDMISSGSLSAGLSGGLGLLGKGAVVAGNRLLRSNLNDTFSEPVVDKVIKNIGLTKPIKKDWVEIREKTQKSVADLLEDYGKQVGAAKKQAITSGATINPQNTKLFIQAQATKSKIPVAYKIDGKESTVGGIDVLKKTLDELGDTSKMSIDDATTALNNIDSHLSPIYIKQATPGAKLTQAEQYALQVRGKLNQQINNVVEPGLGKAKGQYASLKGLLGENRRELAKKLTNPDDVYQVLNQALKESDTPMLKRLTEIDAMLPESEKFLDEAMRKSVSSKINKKAEFEPEKGWYNVINYPLRKLAPLTAAALRSAPTISKGKELVSREIGTIGGTQ